MQTHISDKNQRLRIVHLSTSDIAGGAARAAYRLHQGLGTMGHDSRMLVMNKSSDDPTVTAFIPPRDPIGRVRRHLRRSAINRDGAPYQSTRPQGLEPFSDDRSMHGSALLAQLPPCDIVNLHWVAGFVDYTSFFRSVPQRMPIVWRLSDANPFTGGCHYDENCGQFIQQCGTCPQLGSNDPFDLSFQIWQRKQAVLSALKPTQLHIVALSNWIAREAGRSSLFHHFPISIIPNGIDTQVFAPADRQAARALFRIPAAARVVMFSAGSIENRRKGLPQLIDAMAGLGQRQDLVLLSLGGGKPMLNGQFQHIHLGHLEDDQRIAQAYCAADLFVVPSLQENLPNTALEAMACGTPVVGFDAGGIPDLVRSNITGLLAPVGDVGGLRTAIAALLDDEPRRATMAITCRQVVLAEYTPELQVQRYTQLYQRLSNH